MYAQHMASSTVQRWGFATSGGTFEPGRAELQWFLAFDDHRCLRCEIFVLLDLLEGRLDLERILLQKVDRAQGDDASTRVDASYEG